MPLPYATTLAYRRFRGDVISELARQPAQQESSPFDQRRRTHSEARARIHAFWDRVRQVQLESGWPLELEPLARRALGLSPHQASLRPARTARRIAHWFIKPKPAEPEPNK